MTDLEIDIESIKELIKIAKIKLQEKISIENELIMTGWIVTNIFKEDVYGYETTLIETEFYGMWEGRSGVRVRRIYKAKSGALLNEFF